MNLRFSLESPEYLDILKTHFDVSGYLDDDTMGFAFHNLAKKTKLPRLRDGDLK